MNDRHRRWGIGVVCAVAVSALAVSSMAQSAAQKQPDAVAADPKHYGVEFENDIVRVLRVRLGPGESAPAHRHAAYCAVEITDSSLREGTGPVSESKAGQVFCGDALSHAPTNVGKAVAESIVVEFTTTSPVGSRSTVPSGTRPRGSRRRPF